MTFLSETRITENLLNLKPDKAQGPDGVCAMVLRILIMCRGCGKTTRYDLSEITW